MKSIVTQLSCLICFFVFPLMGGDKPVLLGGKTAFPFMNAQGELQFFYKEGENRINLAKYKIGGEEIEIQNVFQCEGFCAPVLDRDKKGEVHILWAANREEESEVFLGTVKSSGLSESRVFHRGEGHIHSPDICFDGLNNLWAVWVIHINSENFLMVKNEHSEKSWIFDPYFFSEIQAPKILADIQDKVWLFWTGVKEGREEVFYSSFDGMSWSKPERVNKNNDFPHTLLSAETGPNGFPWLVWSAYDGKDYEIYSCFWTLSGWSEEEKITDNLYTDTFPDIGLVWNDIPIIVWSRSDGKQNAIFCKYHHQSEWSQEIRLTGNFQQFLISPRVVTEGGQIGLVWESEKGLYSERFYFSDLIGDRKDEWEKIRKEILINPTLSDDRYIGFGDSITYGYIDSEPAPDKGYVPRLEKILDSTYGESEVINQGNPGEKTVGGLSRISDVLSECSGRYLLLMEGTNDVVTNSISMDTAAFNLEEMAKISLESGVLPLISTILPRDDLWWYLPYYKQRLYSLNSKIREIPGRLRIPFLDMFYEFFYFEEGEQDWRSLLSQDRLHPNEEGYEFMAQKWFEEIKDFPFPPVITEARRANDEVLFNSESGNLIKWKESTKLTNANIYKGYKVYRKKHSAPMTEFKEIQFLAVSVMVNYKQYFDTDINPEEDYCYAVSLVRRDDVEGPCSNIVVVGSVK